MDQPDLGDGRWYTLAEAAAACRRSEGTIQNLISKYQLPRRRVRAPGRHRGRRKIILLSTATVLRLRELTLGF